MGKCQSKLIPAPTTATRSVRQSVQALAASPASSIQDFQTTRDESELLPSTSCISSTPPVHHADCALCASIDIGWCGPAVWSASSEHIAKSHIIAPSLKSKLIHNECKSCDRKEASSCLTCQHLRIEHLLLCCNPTHWGGDSNMRIILKLRSEEQITCEFCKYLHESAADAKVIELELVKTTRSYIKVLSSNKSFYGILNPAGAPQLTEYVDWKWAAKWLRSLKDGYNESFTFDPSYCGDVSVPESRIDYSSQKVHDLRVIDVAKGCIVRLPHRAQFVALSYVWGARSDRDDDFQALKSLMEELKQPGILNKLQLPQTVEDAIVACKNLRCRYLWTDRLCIIQDDSWDKKSVQLNQMAAIYGKAVLTIVACEGNSASHGLVGVSRPRTCGPTAFNINERFGVIEEAPSLKEILKPSIWRDRAWTFQEYLASSTLLFFTEHGLHILKRLGGITETFAEGPARHHQFEPLRTGIDLIEEYTTKSLSHDTDILRAIAGILHANYGDRILQGLPLNEFQRAIAWSPVAPHRRRRKNAEGTAFPSWSWTSCYGAIYFQEVEYSLACWGYEDISNCNSDGTAKWIRIPSKLAGLTRQQAEADVINAALACAEGCLESYIPKLLRLDCLKETYVEGLYTSRREDCTYDWRSAFEHPKKDDIFEGIDIKPSDTTHRLILRTQKLNLFVDDPHLHRGRSITILRTKNCQIAGTVSLDIWPAKWLQPLDRTECGFIALSIHNSTAHPWLEPVVKRPKQSSDISASFGCPCATDTSRDIDPEGHIVECPQHFAFNDTVPFHEPRDFEEFTKYGEDYFKATCKHLGSVSYLDSRGELMHEWARPPMVNVMMIRRKRGVDEEGIVYERLGFGKVYLRRWVEMEPRFETLVLE